MVTVTVVPSPGALSTRQVPPCSRTRSLVSARPMPEPSWVRARAPSMRWNRSNSRGRSAARDADAAVAYREPDLVVRLGQLDRHPPFERELQRVREQVEDDLLPHRPVDEHAAPRAGRRRRGIRARHAGTPSGTNWPDRRSAASDPWARTRPPCGRPRGGRNRAGRSRASAAAGRCGTPCRGCRPRALGRERRAPPRSARATASAACGTRG